MTKASMTGLVLTGHAMAPRSAESTRAAEVKARMVAVVGRRSSEQLAKGSQKKKKGRAKEEREGKNSFLLFLNLHSEDEEEAFFCKRWALRSRRLG